MPNSKLKSICKTLNSGQPDRRGSVTTYLDLAVKLFGRYRHSPPSGIFYFHHGQVVFNAVTAEIVIGNTVLDMDDFVDNVLARGRGRAVIAQYVAELLATKRPTTRTADGWRRS